MRRRLCRTTFWLPTKLNSSCISSTCIAFIVDSSVKTIITVPFMFLPLTPLVLRLHLLLPPPSPLGTRASLNLPSIAPIRIRLVIKTTRFARLVVIAMAPRRIVLLPLMPKVVLMMLLMLRTWWRRSREGSRE